MEFSTSGCRSMLGTTTSRLAGSIDFSIVSFGPKRTRFDVEILVDGLELLAQRDEVLLAPQQSAEQSRELDDERARRLGLRADERGDRRQRVEQKMRVDLARERGDAGRDQQLLLFLQPVFDARAVPDLDRDGHAEHRGQHHEAQEPRGRRGADRGEAALARLG